MTKIVGWYLDPLEITIRPLVRAERMANSEDDSPSEQLMIWWNTQRGLAGPAVINRRDFHKHCSGAVESIQKTMAEKP